MAEGFEFERALKLRDYLLSISGHFDWEAELDAIKAEMAKHSGARL